MTAIEWESAGGLHDNDKKKSFHGGMHEFQPKIAGCGVRESSKVIKKF